MDSRPYSRYTLAKIGSLEWSLCRVSVGLFRYLEWAGLRRAPPYTGSFAPVKGPAVPQNPIFGTHKETCAKEWAPRAPQFSLRARRTLNTSFELRLLPAGVTKCQRSSAWRNHRPLPNGTPRQRQHRDRRQSSRCRDDGGSSRRRLRRDGAAFSGIFGRVPPSVTSVVDVTM